MADNLTKQQRSYNMSMIHSKNTKPELVARPLMRKLGFSYQPCMYGKPDFASSKEKTVVFIDGCFWHKCPLCFRSPKANLNYWIPKLDKNVQRDSTNEMKLRNSGWKVAVIWEHEIKSCPTDELQNLLQSKGIILRNKGELKN